jgi:hypothetical protein
MFWGRQRLMKIKSMVVSAAPPASSNIGFRPIPWNASGGCFRPFFFWWGKVCFEGIFPMYRPALQERLREAGSSRPTSALGDRSSFRGPRPHSASSTSATLASDASRANQIDHRSGEFHSSISTFTSWLPTANSSAPSASKSMRDDAKLLYQELQRIDLAADYTLKFSSASGTCSADMLRDYLMCLEQHAGSLEKPFSTFLQQERDYCKERADVLFMFHKKYLELVRTSFKQLSASCSILRQYDEKKKRDANAAHQGSQSSAQLQSLLISKTQELSAAESSFAQKFEAKHVEFLALQSRCIELEKELHDVKESRDHEIAKSKEWYQWELQFAEDKLDQAELKVQLLQEQALLMKNGLLLSTKTRTNPATNSNSSKGTQTFWKTADLSASEMPMHQGSSLTLPPDSQALNDCTTKDSAATAADDDDDDDDTIKSKLRKFLVPPVPGDIKAIKRRALVELILDGNLESGSIEYLKAIDSGKALSKSLLLKSISEIYATRTLLLQSGESISPYLTHDLGRFTLAHYRKRFGLKKLAEKRTSGIIRAVRMLRSSSNRIDLFGQFFGIDSSLPQKCLDIYIKLLIYIENMPEAPHIENEEATAVCWVPLEKFIIAFENVIGSDLESQDLEDILAKAELMAIPHDKKKHVFKINFDKICCSIFVRVIHGSQASAETGVTGKLLNGIEDLSEESGINRRIFFDIISAGNPSILRSSTDTLYDEGIKRQHGTLGFKSDDGRLRLSSKICSDLIDEFVLDGAPSHAPSLELQNARQNVVDALTTFWMRNGSVIEMKLREMQVTAARLAETMHLFFKGYLQKENTLSLWILTRSMIADLKLGKTIAERTRAPENLSTAKMKSTVKKLMMVSLLQVIS